MDELLPGMAMEADAVGTRPDQVGRPDLSCPPRLRRPDRFQMVMRPQNLDEVINAEHPVRLVWALVEKLDLTKFTETIAARGDAPGRPATDPRLLVALWLYATMENVGRARRLERLCDEHDAYRWICGGVTINHHTLSDFRVGHGDALDELLTQLVVALRDQGIVSGERISQDSLRVRASAGRSSYRRRATLEKLVGEARRRVEELKQRVHDPDDDTTDNRKHAARERAARERLERTERALQLLPELEAIKEHRTGKPSKDQEARVSTTDPEARRIRRGDGSMGPGYNVQFAADTGSRAILDVSIHTGSDDQSQSTPVRERVQQRTGVPVKEHLYDSGYLSKEEIEKADGAGVAVYTPLPEDKHGRPCVEHKRDTPGVTRWRERMQTDAAKEIYKLRASTSETVNADVATYRTLSRFNVRGPDKVRCVALWAALAYMAVQLGQELVKSLSE